MKMQLAIAAACLAAASACWSQEARFKVSADGQEVLDTRTQLVWKRCPEGMSFKGTSCTGKALKFSLGMARKKGEGGWRVPSKDELTGIVIKSKKKPMVDKEAFPATPSTVFLATRPGFNDNLNGSLVDFGTGKVYGSSGSKHHLRLVRDQ
ncbi:MAG: DUF1566 domain-containing protein [Burkholderiales bacterium]|nr:DUF1566 domain-containing protein [Burkholderiales bacterium]